MVVKEDAVEVFHDSDIHIIYVTALLRPMYEQDSYQMNQMADRITSKTRRINIAM